MGDTDNRNSRLEVKRYNDLRSRWEANAVALQERLLASDSAEQQASLLSVRCAEEAVTDANLADCLHREKSENSRKRLLFVPLRLKDCWVSVLLDIDGDCLVEASYICSETDALDVIGLLYEAIEKVYPDFQGQVLSFEGAIQREVGNELSEVIAIQNGLLLLERAYKNGSFKIASQEHDHKKLLELSESQETNLNTYRNRIAKLSPDVLDRLMQNQVSVSANDLAQLSVVSRNTHRSVMKVPARVEALKAASCVKSKIVTNYSDTFLQNPKGEWFACGRNMFGQLGFGDGKRRAEWTSVQLPAGVEIDRVLAGGFHSFLRSQTGEWFACGNGASGQLGLGDNAPRSEWTQVTLPTGDKINRVVLGLRHSFLQSQTGEWFVCGDNEFGQLGFGDGKRRAEWTPVRLPAGVEIDRVLAGGFHSFLRSKTGEWFVCGNGGSGQLGFGDNEDRAKWTLVALPTGDKIDRVVTGGRHSFLQSQTGEWFASGNNENGQLGLGDTENRAEWTPVRLPTGDKIDRVVTGGRHSFLQSQTGEWFVCGNNSYGQLGLGNTENKAEWTQVTLPAGDKIDRVVVGIFHSFLQSQTGEWFACGNGASGQLGFGDNKARAEWTRIVSPADASLTSLPSLLEQSCDAVATYLDNPSVDAAKRLVNALSKEQLLLVPYKMNPGEAYTLNQYARQAFQSAQGVGASVVSSSPELFPPSNDAASINYLVRLKETMSVSDCVDDNTAGFDTRIR